MDLINCKLENSPQKSPLAIIFLCFISFRVCFGFGGFESLGTNQNSTVNFSRNPARMNFVLFNGIFSILKRFLIVLE